MSNTFAMCSHMGNAMTCSMRQVSFIVVDFIGLVLLFDFYGNEREGECSAFNTPAEVVATNRFVLGMPPK